VPATLGEHLRRARLDRGFRQRHAAREIGCSQASLASWEAGRGTPGLRFLPGILGFLGYDPRILATSLCDGHIPFRSGMRSPAARRQAR
jgi:transcriptional regulator with XRE-family HTH domain